MYAKANQFEVVASFGEVKGMNGAISMKVERVAVLLLQLVGLPNTACRFSQLEPIKTRLRSLARLAALYNLHER